MRHGVEKRKGGTRGPPYGGVWQAHLLERDPSKKKKRGSSRNAGVGWKGAILKTWKRSHDKSASKRRPRHKEPKSEGFRKLKRNQTPVQYARHLSTGENGRGLKSLK